MESNNDINDIIEQIRRLNVEEKKVLEDYSALAKRQSAIKRERRALTGKL